jgi:hypothetical protein
MTSYNQIVGVIEAIAAAHQQVKSYGDGDLWQITEQGDIEYPRVWITPDIQGSSIDISQKELPLSLKLTFIDLKNEDESNEREIQSDQLLIAFDFLSQLQLYEDMFTVQPNARVEFVNEKINNQDAVAGCMLSLQLRVDYLSDWCGIPSTLVPAGENGCAPVNVYDGDGNLLATVASGGTVTSTAILDAMTGAEIVSDIESNAGAQLTYIEDYYAQKWTLSVSFNDPVTKNIRYRFGESVQITGIAATSGSYTGATVYKNETAVTLPSTFGYGDEMRVNFATLTAGTGGTTDIEVNGKFVAESFDTAVNDGSKINELYIPTQQWLSVYNIDQGRFTKQLYMSGCLASLFATRIGRKIYRDLNNGSTVCEVDADTMVLTANTYSWLGIYGNSSKVNYNGYVWIADYGSVDLHLYKINTVTLIMTATAALTAASMGNPQRISVTTVYNGKIIVTADSKYAVLYNVATDTWSNYTNLGNSFSNQTCHIADGYIYYLGLTSGKYDIYRCSATDLSGAAVYKSLQINAVSVSYFLIDGDLAYILSGQSNNIILNIYKISTSALIATINTNISTNGYNSSVFDNSRNRLIIVGQSIMSFIDLTNYIVHKTVIFQGIQGASSWVTPFLSDYDDPKIYYV